MANIGQTTYKNRILTHKLQQPAHETKSLATVTAQPDIYKSDL